MEFKGTKGKWVVGYEQKDKPSIEALNDNGKEYRTVIQWADEHEWAGIIHTGEEQKANALLISKAPEMLEALDLVQDKWIKETLEWKDIVKIQQLITEATTPQ